MWIAKTLAYMRMCMYIVCVCVCVCVCRAAMFPAVNANSKNRHAPRSIHAPVYYPFCMRVHLSVHFQLAGVSAHIEGVCFIVSPTTAGPSLLQNGYRVPFSEVKPPGVMLTIYIF